MKAIFIGLTAVIIYYTSTKYRSTYNVDDDTFPLYWVIPPCLILAFFVHEEFTFLEVSLTTPSF